MTAGKNVSVEDLRQNLVEVGGKKPARRFVIAINHLEDDDLTRTEAPERHGSTVNGLTMA